MILPIKFSRHKAVDVPFAPARWTGAGITPEIVILHDTASRLDPGSAAHYLQDNTAKVSVHFVVERDGAVTQQVPVNRRANHAGKSSYHGRPAVNGFSVGIEIVNPGKMEMLDGGYARAWWGSLYAPSQVRELDIEVRETPEHGRGAWMAYPEAQIGAVMNLLAGLFGAYDTLRDIRTHWYVSPGRKVDTNPLFPLEAVRAKILGREDWAGDVADGAAVPFEAAVMGKIDVPGDTLNMRAWPSFNPNVIAAIPHGTEVPILRAGRFDGREWLKVLYGGREGWVVSAYVTGRANA